MASSIIRFAVYRVTIQITSAARHKLNPLMRAKVSVYE
jgi:hypothetical protein